MTEVSKYRYDFPNDGAKNAVIKYIKAYPYSIKTLTPVSRYLNLVQSKSAMDEFREIANVYPGSFLKEYLYNSIFEKKILFNYPENENPPGIKDERKNKTLKPGSEYSFLRVTHRSVSHIILKVQRFYEIIDIKVGHMLHHIPLILVAADHPLAV